MRSAGDALTEVQVRVGRLFGCVLGRHVIDRASARRRLQGEHLQALAIDAHLDLMWLGEPFDQLIAIARKAKLELIFTVGRKGVSHAGASTRAERLSVEMIFLREVRWKDDGFGAGGAHRCAYRKPADFLR